jgi:hypothetical protein
MRKPGVEGTGMPPGRSQMLQLELSGTIRLERFDETVIRILIDHYDLEIPPGLR